MVHVVCASSDDALYFHKVTLKYLERFSQEIIIVEFQWGITPKMYRQELRRLCVVLIV